MEAKQSAGASDPEDGFELDPNDTMSVLPEVIRDAVAAVKRDPSAAEETPDDDQADFSVPDSVAIESAEGEAEAAESEEAAAAEGEADEDEESAEVVVDHELQARAERLEAEVGALRDRLLRTRADFENFRKRSDREMESLRRYALFDALGDFLAVADNLERALAASGSTDNLKQGVEMITRQLHDLLRRHGVEPIAAVGKPFDPNLHEAVTKEEGAEVDEPTVTAELQRGYLFHDRLLRPAMVNVAMPAPEPQEAGEEEEEGEGESEMAAENGSEEDDESAAELVGETEAVAAD